MAGGAFALGEAVLPWLDKILYTAGTSVITQVAKRKIADMLGYTAKQPRRKRRRYKSMMPTYRKGFDRVGGFYGRFKPDFGKELKFFDTITTNLPVLDDWSAGVGVSLIGKGTGPSVRVGRALTIRSLQMRLKVSKDVGVQALVVRIIVLLDKQTNGENFSPNDVWLNGGTSSTTTWSAYRNLEFVDRFEILWDKTYTFNSRSDANGKTTIADSYYKKINIPMLIGGTADTAFAPIADIQTNNIYVAQCADTPSDSKISYSFRVRFTG